MNIKHKSTKEILRSHRFMYIDNMNEALCLHILTILYNMEKVFGIRFCKITKMNTKNLKVIQYYKWDQKRFA